MSLVFNIKKVIRFFKIDIKKYPDLDKRRRKKLYAHYKIDKILDVGANNGQYAELMFSLGYKGEIISFEPVKSVFSALEKKSKKRDNWEVLNCGLGDKNEVLDINISENTFSSSVLNITSSHVKGAPESRYSHKEKIEIKTLDSIYDELVLEGETVLLKMDVQGYEKNVLIGALESIKKIEGIQIEMSLEELYKGEMLLPEAIKLLNSYGFDLFSLENEFHDEETGKLLQVDGIFFKRKIEN
jgi:FkbM family methyltransferase